MESLAFTHCAAAYEDPTALELRSFDELGLNIPSSAWLNFAAVAVVLSIMATKPEPASAALRYGDTGSAVRQLQELLVMKSDGVFGQQTYDRVVSFQRNNGLSADGVVGPQTASALGLNDYNSGYNPVGVGSSGTHIVSASGLNIRSGPGLGYSVIGSLGNGATAYLTSRRVYNNGSNWGKLAYRSGWIATDHVYKPAGSSGGSSYKHYVAASRLNVRSGPGLGYSVISSLGSGTGVYLTSERVYRSGYTWGHLTRGGWVATNHLIAHV